MNAPVAQVPIRSIRHPKGCAHAKRQSHGKPRHSYSNQHPAPLPCPLIDSRSNFSSLGMARSNSTALGPPRFFRTASAKRARARGLFGKMSRDSVDMAQRRVRAKSLQRRRNSFVVIGPILSLRRFLCQPARFLLTCRTARLCLGPSVSGSK